jgi:hypothetical protein
VAADQARDSQRSMLGTKVVDRSGQVHRSIQALAMTSDSPRLATECSNMTAKSAVEAFDKSGVQNTTASDLVAQPFNRFRAALHDPSFDAFELLASISFDDLYNVEVGPFNQLGTPTLSAPTWFAENFFDLSRVARKSISDKEQASVQPTGGAFDPLDQFAEQTSIAHRSDAAAQPQTCGDFDGHRHPAHNPRKQLDTNLVHLDFAQLARLLDQMLVNSLAMSSTTFLPIDHRPFIYPEGENDGLNRTPARQQLKDQHDHLDWFSQPVKRSPV